MKIVLITYENEEGYQVQRLVAEEAAAYIKQKVDPAALITDVDEEDMMLLHGLLKEDKQYYSEFTKRRGGQC